MIDNELDQLSRALIAATDRLNSQDFKDRQSKYVQLEQEFLALGSELEAEERAVEKAQAALQQHVAVTYLDAEIFETVPAPEADEAEQKLHTKNKAWDDYRDVVFGTAPHFEDITPIPSDEDEYASAKANGALS